MSNTNEWTAKEKQLMQEKYCRLGPKGMSYLVAHSPMSCRTMAGVLGLKVDSDVISEARKVLCKERKTVLLPAPRKPFDDIPREYVKAQSIFRVGQRYAIQVGK